MIKKDLNYIQVRAELDDLLAWFESDDVNIEEAIAKYQRAEELLEQLDEYLSDTQAKIIQITKQFKEVS